MRTSNQTIDYIMEIAREKDISQAELGRLADINKSTLSRYINHTREFPINAIGKFAKALNTTVEDLLGVDHEKKKKPSFENFENLVNATMELGSLNLETIESDYFQKLVLQATKQDLLQLIK